MSISITPNAGSQEPNKPKKNIFGMANQKAVKLDSSREGVFVGRTAVDGLTKEINAVAKGALYSGDPKLPQILDSYHRMLTGEKRYGNGDASGHMGARFGFVGQLSRRLPSPVLFDDPEVAQFLFRGNEPTACIDSSGRSWYWAGFFEQCLQEEAREKTMVMPLMIHENLHIGLNHNGRMHNFPADVANWAKDKVINPMTKVFFDKSTYFSAIFSEAHGNNAADAKYRGLSEETIGKQIIAERQKALEELGTIHIKNLIVIDGPVRAITTLKAGRGELKEYDTVTVRVEDLGLMDKIDHVFECATLEIDTIDNRLKTRKRNGSPGPAEDQEDAPIMIPTESDASADGSGNSKSKPGSDSDGKPSDGSGNSEDDPGRKSLEQVRQDVADKQANQAAASSSNESGNQGTAKSPGAPSGAPGQMDSPGNGTQSGQAPQQGQRGRDEPRGKPGNGQIDMSGPGTEPGLSGSPDDVLGNIFRGNPMDAPSGHEIDVNELNDWLKATGRQSLVDTMRLDDFAPEQMERIIEVALGEAEKERLIIGSGYAGGHVNDYMNTVVRPSKIYKMHWERRVTEFAQGGGTHIARSMDEYGIYTYIDPTDLGMTPDDGVYYEGSIQQKPDERMLVLVDTSGSVWADKKRLGHFLAFAVGIRATADDMAPDIDIVGADTVITGKPRMYDDETILDAIERGVPLGGGGGTDFATPINQILAWAKENDISYQGIIYVTDFECGAPLRQDLPEDMPPLVWAGMPHDHAKAEGFIRAVSSYSEVVIIEDEATYDFAAAQEKAIDNAHLGHSRLTV